MNQPGTKLTKDQYIDAIRTNSALLAEAAERHLSVAIPTCPGWSMAELAAHIGEVQRFWTLQIQTRAQEQQNLSRSAYDSCPGLYEWLDGVDRGEPDLAAVPDCLIDWFRDATGALVAAFQQVEPQEAIWHWSGDNRAITHMRNQAMEATLHRWDAQNAVGDATPIDGAIALDGIDQHFGVQIPAARRGGQARQGNGELYHFHRTDGPGEWLVQFHGDDITVRKEHGKGDVAVRGTVEDLFLWLWGRIPAGRLEIHGDASLLNRYRELVPSS